MSSRSRNGSGAVSESHAECPVRYSAIQAVFRRPSNAEEARRAVASTRYPTEGIRGVAVATRAGRYGRVTGYLNKANAEICVLVQVETGPALEQLEAIAKVEGVDGVFIGPSDLAASLGHLGNP